MTSSQDEIERRVELAGKVNLLEERTTHIGKAVDRIEKSLSDQAMKEQAAFHNFTDTKVDMLSMVNELKDSVEKKLDETVDKIEKQIIPLQNDVAEMKETWSNVKFGWKMVVGALSILGAVILFFKDAILHWFGLK